MTILALEFSPDERSAALFVEAKVRGYASDQRFQSISSIALIKNALEQAGVDATRVEGVAVGLGPGSYAGIRTAIAIAQGWQVARAIKLLGVSSAEAIAWEVNRAEEALSKRPPFQGIANIVFDGQRQQAYAIRYKIGGAGPLALGTFSLLTPEEETRRHELGEIFIKADSGPSQRGDDRIVPSDARLIGEIASQKKELLSECQLEPVYLRDAEFVKAPSPKFIP